jgi:hypothetical protein
MISNLDESDDDIEYESRMIKPKKRLKKAKLVFNVLNTHYSVIKKVAKTEGYKLSDEEEEDWDIYWCDTGIQPEKLLKMKNY